MSLELNLTEEQYNVLRNATESAKNLSAIIYRDFKRVGLDRMPGCYLEMSIQPEFKNIALEVQFGYTHKEDAELGYFDLTRGVFEDEWDLSERSSEEYKILFAGEDIRRRIRKIVSDEESVSSYSLWISDHDDPPVVDGGQ